MSIGEATTEMMLPANKMMVPVESDVFDTAPLADFYMGCVAVPGQVLLPEENRAHGVFRANVYIDKLQWLPESVRRADGSEWDSDDDRSMRFAAIENLGSSGQRVVGVSRLIIKDSMDSPLPVERYFPEAFEMPVAKGAAEASRFIAEHPDKTIQHAIALANIRTMAMSAVEVDAETVYATVERKLALYFEMLRLPYRKLSELRVLPGYGHTKNMAIAFSPREIIEAAESPELQGTELAELFAPEARSNQGLGYYGLSLNERAA